MVLPTRAIGFMSTIQLGLAEGLGGNGNNMANFGVKSSTPKFSSQEFEVGDTESGPFMRHQPGRFMFESTFTAFVDTQVQNFARAIVGGVVWLKYYPSGIKPANQFVPKPAAAGATLQLNLPGGGGNDPFNCPNFVIFEGTVTQDVGNPVTFEFRGKCDDAFRSPTTTG